MIQLCLRLKMTDCSLNEAVAEAMSFIPNQAASEAAIINGTQTNPAFCSQMFSPVSAEIWASPPIAPNTPMVITIGTKNCMTDTPALPRPALSASALPFCAFGKKNEILAIDEAKLPPPNPQSSASTMKSQYGVSGF